MVYREFFCIKNHCRIKNKGYICTRKSETIEVVFKSGSVVQLVRIHACHAWGRGFESRPNRRDAC